MFGQGAVHHNASQKHSDGQGHGEHTEGGPAHQLGDDVPTDAFANDLVHIFPDELKNQDGGSDKDRNEKRRQEDA